MWMLGNNPVGGYSSIWPWTLGSAVLNLSEIFRLYVGSWWIMLPVLIPVIGCLLLMNDMKKAGWEIFRHFFIFLLFCLPLLPVSSILSGGESLRYVFLTSTYFTFIFVISSNTVYERGIILLKITAFTCMLIVLAVVGYMFCEERKTWDNKRETAFAEGTFFLDHGESADAMLKITQHHWFFDGLEKMRSLELQRPISRKIRLVSDQFYSLEEVKDAKAIRVFAYDAFSSNIVDVTDVERKRHEEFLKMITEKPLEVSLSMKEGIMRVHLGPYEGNYIMLEAPPDQPDFYYLAFTINREFGIKLTHREKVRIFRFGYKSPEGWMTLSPKFLIDRSKDSMISWRR
jgi:hypothetical protein